MNGAGISASVRRRRKFFFPSWPVVAIVLSCLAYPAFAQHGGTGGRPVLGASATFDRDGVVWAVDVQSEQVLVRHSRDLGASWSEPVAVNAEPEPIAADGDGRPKVVAAPGGELYVTWTRPLSRPYTGEIRFSRSLDGGRSWSAPIVVHADRQEITHRFDAPTVTEDGRLFIAWIDKRDQEAAKAAGRPYRGAAVYFAVSDDRGASFRGDYRLAEHGCECCRIATLADGDGVLAFWRHVFEPNIRDHALARLNPDGGSDAMRRATFDDWAVDACPHHGPSLARDDRGDLHAVWFTLGPNNTGVFYGRLGDNMVHGQRRVGGEASEHADIVAAGARLAVAWKEFDGQAMLLRAMVSEDRGETWTEHTLASTHDASDQPRLLEHQGRFFVFWNTREQPHRMVALP